MKIYSVTLLTSCGQYISGGIVKEDAIDRFIRIYGNNHKFPKVCIEKTWIETKENGKLIIAITNKGREYVRVKEGNEKLPFFLFAVAFDSTHPELSRIKVLK